VFATLVACRAKHKFVVAALEAAVYRLPEDGPGVASTARMASKKLSAIDHFRRQIFQRTSDVEGD